MPTEFTTPVGRIVWGNPAKPQIKKDQNTNQPVLRDGQQVQQWVFGVAFPKAEFESQVMPYLQQEAATGFPNGFPPNFSWKFKDGDTTLTAKGVPYNTMEGRAGCYILTVSTEAFAPEIYKNEGGAYRQMEANEIKCGDYVVVSLNVKVNVPTNATHTPGLYINPKGLEHVGYGNEITGASANPEEMFGGAVYQLPPGASATPVVPVTGAAAPYATPAAVPLGVPPVPLATAQAVNPLPGVALPAAANTLPPPATGFVQQAGVAPVPQPQTAVAPLATPPSIPPAGMPGNGVANPLPTGQAVPTVASPSDVPAPVAMAGMPPGR